MTGWSESECWHHTLQAHAARVSHNSQLLHARFFVVFAAKIYRLA
jgi:hypothetical protein